MRRALLLMFAWLLALLGCDARMSELKPGVSTATEVKSIMGQPAFEWKEPDGTVTWEFPRGPSGSVTYMVDLRPDGVLKAIRQVLIEAYFAKIQPGLSQDEVRKLIGKPAETMTFPLKKEEVWSWKFEQGSGEKWHYHVHFDLGGKVVTATRNRVEEP
jgi:outer membrane protein assembly factor BamE (lipoprotein component of BamABCDE complex)